MFQASIAITKELDDWLTKTSKQMKRPKEAVIMTAVTLLDHARKQKTAGNRLVVLNPENEIINEISGY